MKIGILGAMLEEVSLIKEAMTVNYEETIANRCFYSGKLCDKNTVLVFSRWGKVAVSSTVTTLINKFGIDLIIFIGVAGAVSNQLNVGDIVIANSLYQHDMDTRPIFKRYQIPLTNEIFLKPAASEIEAAKKAADSFLNNLENYLQRNILHEFLINSPKFYVGTIATGDQFISNVSTHEAFNLENQTVLAVEMEGAAVAQVCNEYKIPYIVIRTISDRADHTAPIDFQDFVNKIAAYYSKGILQELYKII